ncbi:Predicted component of the type VI protein secretion system [Chelatococcus sambhunathii]|nr:MULTISPECIES: GPW/gp25 family protein [Chelatococcus]CUA89890.1 Predicted component of the type VI protein secretion system [Chelatococcus sambhunathii]
MVNPKSKDRLRPPLMYAFREAHAARDARKKLDLRDEAGERIVAGRRGAPRLAITDPKLRQEVIRDLEILLNTVNLASSLPLDAAEHVRCSILNYGRPDLVRRSIDEFSVGSIGAEIAETLARFEPRLARDSLTVVRDDSVDAAALRVRFLIAAALGCEPLAASVEFVADVELDTGKVVVARR